MRICSTCLTPKPDDDFGKDKRISDGLRAQCRACYNEDQRQYYKRTKEHQKISKRNSELRRKYNLTSDEYDSMLEDQDGVCMICGGNRYPSERLCVDHDHETGKVRGLLCRICNMGLGKFDSLDLARSVVRYLETSRD